MPSGETRVRQPRGGPSWTWWIVPCPARRVQSKQADTVLPCRLASKYDTMRVVRPRALLLVTALVGLSQFATAHGPRGVLALTGADPAITLVGPYASARVLVEARLGGNVRDVSDAVTLTVADPNVA